MYSIVQFRRTSLDSMKKSSDPRKQAQNEARRIEQMEKELKELKFTFLRGEGNYDRKRFENERLDG